MFIGHSPSFSVVDRRGSHNVLLRNASPEHSRLLRHDRSYPSPHSFPRPTRELHEPTNRIAPPRDFLFPISLALFHRRNSRNWENRRRNNRALRYPENIGNNDRYEKDREQSLATAKRKEDFIIDLSSKGTLFPLERLRSRTTEGISYKSRVIWMNRKISSH